MSWVERLSRGLVELRLLQLAADGDPV